MKTALLMSVIVLTFTACATFLDNKGSRQPATRDISQIFKQGLEGKIIAGYQGWFRMPGDGTDAGFSHWSMDKARLSKQTAVFDIWPYMKDYSDDERYELDFAGKKVSLFSSINPKTVERHFRWMEKFAIDGAEIQRFIKDLSSTNRKMDILSLVDDASRKTGRCFYIGYDFTNANETSLYDIVSSDWGFLSENTEILRSPTYLYDGSRPIIQLWGLFYPRVKMETAEKVLAFFRRQKSAPMIIGGVTWDWRSHPKEWIEFYKKYDLVRPWNIPHSETVAGVIKASTNTWLDDIALLKESRARFVPTVYPGFRWNNLIDNAHPVGLKPKVVPRRNGQFYWEQFVELKALGLRTAFIAMFDEVNEGTAVFEIDSNPPSQIFFHEETISPDWYLYLSQQGKDLILGTRKSMLIPSKR